MCYDRQNAAQTQLQLAGTAALAPAKSASYWACQGALAQHCDTAFNSVPRDKCMSCAHDHLSELLNNGCSVDLIAKACSEPHGCTDAMQASCGKSGTASACRKQNQTACKECEQCGFRSPLTSAANCSFELLYESCGDYSHGHHHRSIYDEWMGGLACLAGRQLVLYSVGLGMPTRRQHWRKLLVAPPRQQPCQRQAYDQRDVC